MYKEVLRTIQGVEIYPLISLGIFFLFFIITLVRVLKTDKKEIQEMSNIPFSDAFPANQHINQER
jgi:cytochrome c oxidase cbb3-type subunit 4